MRGRSVVLAVLLTLLATGFLGAATAQDVPFPPPAHFYRDVQPVCDLDGDGTDDLLLSRLELDSPPSRATAVSRVFGISGASGKTIWERGNGDISEPSVGGEVTWARPGIDGNQPPKSLVPIGDVTGDGVCDAVMLNFGGETVAGDPLLGSARVRLARMTVTVVSGANGETAWSMVAEGTEARARDVFGTAAGSAVVGLPTGFLAFDAPDGPRFALKTTDVVMDEVNDPTGLTGVALGEPIAYEDARVVDHVQLMDATDGAVLWQRDLGSERDERWTNITWLVAADDLDGDAEPDLVIEQLMIANPRGNEVTVPVAGEQPYHFARGLLISALDGDPGGAGETLWERAVVDPLGVQPDPPVEESFEVLVWTGSKPLPDITGDGTPEVLARYLAAEQRTASTLLGGYRTHFVPLDGTDGTPLWDVRATGWGHAAVLGYEGDAPVMGLATLDVPTDVPTRGVTPVQNAYIQVVDGRDGATRWTHDAPVAQLGSVPYVLGLAQFGDAMAPLDLDGDGIRDPAMAPRTYAPTGTRQVLTSTQTQEIEILSADAGARLATVEAWGGTGRLLPCGANGHGFTVLGGHARRYDLMRFNLTTGEQTWRVPLFNDPTLQAATAPVDIGAVSVECHDLDGGAFMVSINLDRFGFERGREVNPVTAVLESDGTVRWIDPALSGTTLDKPLVDSEIHLTSAATDAGWLRPGTLLAPGIGLVLGLASAPALRAAWRRRGDNLPRLAVLGLVLATLAAATPFPTPSADAAVPGPELVQLAGLDAPVGPIDESARDPSGTDPNPSSQHSGAPPMPPITWAPGAPEPGDGRRPSDMLAEGAGLTWSYPVPDGDGDGVDDVVIEAWCVSFALCASPQPALADSAQSFADGVVQGYPCTERHFLWGVSGSTGEVLWSLDLQKRYPADRMSCSQTWVLGTVGLEDGRTGILAYEHVVRSPDNGCMCGASGGFGSTEQSSTTENYVYLVDAATGDTIWSRLERGFVYRETNTAEVSNTFHVDPVLVPGDLETGRPPALFLRGVGWEVHVVDDAELLGPVGLQRRVAPSDSYQPLEWLASIDPATGEELWRVDSFTGSGVTSVYPEILQTGEPDWEFSPYTEIAPRKRNDLHWDGMPCCPDLTGDGVPDPLFVTREWPGYPETNLEGPYVLRSRLITFDGATGSQIWATVVADDVRSAPPPPRSLDPEGGYESWTTPVGDLTGDGSEDVLVQQRLLQADHVHTVTALDGRDGTILWTSDTARTLSAAPFADADGDGALDIALVEWFPPVGDGEDRATEAIPQLTALQVRSGRTGEELWRVETFAAPLDLVAVLDAMRAGGAPDVNGDGVGDLVVDEPFELDDQTTVHRPRVLDGRTGDVIWTTRAVGGLAHPARVPDLDGDGRDEVGLVNGDVGDLWLTVHDGADGTALWSRRLVAMPASSMARVVPHVRIDGVLNEAANRTDVLARLQLRGQLYVAFEIVMVASERGTGVQEFVGVDEFTTTHEAVLSGLDGAPLWTYGSPLADGGDGQQLMGASPATQGYERVLDEQLTPMYADAARNVADAGPQIGLGVLGYALGVLMFAGVLRLRGRHEGVIDLDM